VSRVAEEVQLWSCWPKSHESVAMHVLAHYHGGRTRSCFSTTEVFFSWHFLLDSSALQDNSSDSLFAPDVRIHVAQCPRCQINCQHDFHIRPDPQCLFLSQQMFSNPSWRLHFCFHIVSINPCFIASYSSFRKFSFLLAWSRSSSLLATQLSLWSFVEVVGQTLKLCDSFLILL
jgi:hypothetical protein